METAEYAVNSKTEKPNNLVQTIERVAALLEIMADYPNGISIGVLSSQVQLPKGTVHRLLSSLVYFGFVRQMSDTKNYQLGFKLMELGQVVLSHMDLRNEARPFLHCLAEDVAETVHLVVRDKDEVLYIDKVEPSQKNSGLQMISRVGTRIPMHCSSVGKIILAHLASSEGNAILDRKGLDRRTENTICSRTALEKHLRKIRKSGFAVDNEENEKGIRCVSAPVRDINGRVIAAISVSAPSARVSLKMLESSLKEKICQTAAEVSARLGFSGSS